MKWEELRDLHPGQSIIYVRDDSQPNAIRKAIYHGARPTDIASDYLCVYLDENDKPIRNPHGDNQGGTKTGDTYCSFRDDECGLTPADLAVSLRKKATIDNTYLQGRIESNNVLLQKLEGI